MVRRMSLQLRGALLIMLLAGGESTRIAHQVGHAHAVHTLAKRAGGEEVLSATTGETEVCTDTSLDTGVPKVPSVARGSLGAWWTSGDAVCREKEFEERGPSGETLALIRYKQKAEKIRLLAHKIREADCLKSCPPSYRELKGRLTKMNTCPTLREKSETFPEDLSSAMADTHGGYQKLMMDISQDILAVLKTHNFFPPSEGCGFHPEKLDLLAAKAARTPAEARKALHAQLFGETCSDEASKRYVESVKDDAATLIHELHSKASVILEKMLANDDADAGIDKIMQEVVDADAASLLETSTGEPLIWAIVVVLICLFLFAPPRK